MNYFEVSFVCTPYSEIIGEVLSSELVDIGFESFVDSEDGIVAYIQESLYNKDALQVILDGFPMETTISFQSQLLEGKDWNEEWEKNYFKPLIIDNKCIVQSTFHKEPAVYEYNILIDPKMAFGTGHHQTTELMMREILNMNLEKKSVLDMGCGTAILAILASMRGANPILAIDIDKWAYDNAIENLGLNNISNIDVQIGGAELLANNGTFDIVLANINRNILLNDIQVYASVLNPNGGLYMSGFYTEDIPVLTEECNKHGLQFVHFKEKDNWANLYFIKTP